MTWSFLVLLGRIDGCCSFFAEEMDWDKNGMVNFKEFLFAFTHWVGIEDIDDDEDEGLDNV